MGLLQRALRQATVVSLARDEAAKCASCFTRRRFPCFPANKEYGRLRCYGNALYDESTERWQTCYTVNVYQHVDSDGRLSTSNAASITAKEQLVYSANKSFDELYNKEKFSFDDDESFREAFRSTIKTLLWTLPPAVRKHS